MSLSDAPAPGMRDVTPFAGTVAVSDGPVQYEEDPALRRPPR